MNVVTFKNSNKRIPLSCYVEASYFCRIAKKHNLENDANCEIDFPMNHSLFDKLYIDDKIYKQKNFLNSSYVKNNMRTRHI